MTCLYIGTTEHHWLNDHGNVGKKTSKVNYFNKMGRNKIRYCKSYHLSTWLLHMLFNGPQWNMGYGKKKNLKPLDKSKFDNKKLMCIDNALNDINICVIHHVMLSEFQICHHTLYVCVCAYNLHFARSAAARRKLPSLIAYIFQFKYRPTTNILYSNGNKIWK